MSNIHPYIIDAYTAGVCNTVLRCVVGVLGDFCHVRDDCIVANSYCKSGICMCKDQYEASANNRACTGTRRVLLMTWRVLIKCDLIITSLVSVTCLSAGNQFNLAVRVTQSTRLISLIM